MQTIFSLNHKPKLENCGWYIQVNLNERPDTRVQHVQTNETEYEQYTQSGWAYDIFTFDAQIPLDLPEEEFNQRASEAFRPHKELEIRSYDASDSVNKFMLAGQPLWIDKATRVGLQNSIACEEAVGKTETTLWFNNVQYVFPIASAKQMLVALELYALECYNVTASHLKAVSELTEFDDILDYDYTVGYPECPRFMEPETPSEDPEENPEENPEETPGENTEE